MKNLIKYVLQKILGYQRYLYVFAKYKIGTLEEDVKEGDFFSFLNEIKKEGVLLDVGANIGIMTYHMSTRFPDRKVIAIEPMPTNYLILQRIVKKYNLSNVNLIQKAVGNREETLEMVLPINHSVKMQGLAHVVHDSIGEWNEGDKFSVQCGLLDEIVGDEKISGIKMDIENFEFFALEGARRILSEDKPVLYLELWDNENRDNCFELLEGFGYKPYVKIGHGLVEYSSKDHKKQNFIFMVN